MVDQTVAPQLELDMRTAPPPYDRQQPRDRAYPQDAPTPMNIPALARPMANPAPSRVLHFRRSDRAASIKPVRSDRVRVRVVVRVRAYTWEWAHIADVTSPPRFALALIPTVTLLCDLAISSVLINWHTSDMRAVRPSLWHCA